MNRFYNTLPRIPDAGLMSRYMETLGIIVPAARANMVLNPSLETNTTNWTNIGVGTSLARSTEQQYHGAYSLKVTLDTSALGSDDGVTYGNTTGLSVTSGVTYAISAKVRGVAGVGYYLMYGTSSVTPLARVGFTGTGRWQWVWLTYAETSTSTNRQIFIVRDGTGGSGATVNGPFYIDGVQVEACEAGNLWPTTYIDGDQLGLVSNQYPLAYGWNGTPHASSSYRTGQTRAGGRVVRLKDYGFLLTAIIGLGMAPPRHEALAFAQLDGASYQNTIKPPRTFSLAGRIAATTPTAADVAVSQLSQLVDRDRVALRQPLVVTMQAQECGVDCGQPLTIPALYTGGLEGNNLELPTSQVPITFTQYLPYITSHSQGAALDVQDAIASPGGILARSPTGTWSTLSTGVSGGVVRAIVVGLDGLVYVGGTFTAAGATSADFIASYNPQTATWAVLSSATALNAAVQALAVGPDGRIYVGGAFTNAGGVGAADFIAVWDPVAASWAALSTGMDALVNALCWVGNTLYAGGNFTTAGGGAAARVAAWNGSAWSALGSGAGSAVNALATNGTLLYIGGQFSNGGGVAAADFIGTWNGTVWGALSTGMDASVISLAVAPNGLLYASGEFTVAGGVTAGGIAVWNGQAWAQLGSGFSAPGGSYANEMFALGNGQVLLAANDRVVDAGQPGYVFMWNGAAYVSLGLQITAGEGSAIVMAPDGTIYAGVSGTNVAAGLAIATNGGTVEMWPQVIIRGPSSGTSRLYEIVNRTTGMAIYLNYTIAAGEVLTLTLNPTNTTFVSSFRGNIMSAILPGSQTAQFVLQPGANNITFLSASSTVTAVMQWQLGYANLNDALYQMAAP